MPAVRMRRQVRQALTPKVAFNILFPMKIFEKDMEDAIAKSPDVFLDEKGLSLVARQYRIGSYRFDLLFKDRFGSKLIVEIQKGTLDRNHTYKILDYYHEYKNNNPDEFIDLMVVANKIPRERQQRLNDWGISFQEVPVHSFLDDYKKVHPVKAYFASWMPMILSLKNSRSR